MTVTAQQVIDEEGWDPYAGALRITATLLEGSTESPWEVAMKIFEGFERGSSSHCLAYFSKPAGPAGARKLVERWAHARLGISVTVYGPLHREVS